MENKETIYGTGGTPQRPALADLRPGQSGFSLVELLIAIFILAVGLLGTATMLTTNMGSDRLSHMVTVEAALASSVMEELMAKDPGDPIFTTNMNGVAAVYDLDTGNVATTTRTVQGRTYSATYLTTQSFPVAGVTRVLITVTSGTRTVTLTSYKSVL